MTDLITWFVHYLQDLLVNQGFWGVFFAFVLAEVIAIIPTPLMMMAAGFLLLKGSFSLALLDSLVFSIAIPAALGVTIGSLSIYYPGYFLGKPFVERWGKFLGLSWKHIEKVEAKFASSYLDEIVLLSLRIIFIFPTVTVSFVSGLVRFNMRSYLICTFLGTFVKVVILALLAWQVGELYTFYASFMKGVEKWVFILIIVAVGGYIFYKLKKKQNEE